MKKLQLLISLSLAMAAFSTTCQAQTPARNLMPDGSQDTFIGLGVLSRPIYEGAEKTKRFALPVLQIQWSNGIFVSGSSLGWHLSERFDKEFGPLVIVEPGRSTSGTNNNIGDLSYLANNEIRINISGMPTSSSLDDLKLIGIGGTTAASGGNSNNASDNTADAKTTLKVLTGKNSKQLIGLENLPRRILVGGFYNLQLNERLRLNTNLVGGAGQRRTGIRLSTDLQYSVREIAPHHHINLGLGTSFVNKAYTETYFGVSNNAVLRSPNQPYNATAGIKDIHANLYWNWNFSSSWLLASKVNLTRLVGSSVDSPLVDRRNSLSVSSVIAYRF
ncbi:MAG: MipA/OmpV family protein [Undibacterium sp.]|nr:MipA/OmpV family protein [Undibacterium sp.]